MIFINEDMIIYKISSGISIMDLLETEGVFFLRFGVRRTFN